MSEAWHPWYYQAEIRLEDEPYIEAHPQLIGYHKPLQSTNEEVHKVIDLMWLYACLDSDGMIHDFLEKQKRH